MYLLKKQSASYSPFDSFYRKHILYATRKFQGQGPNPQTGQAKTCSQSIWLGGKISFQTKNLMKYFVTVKYNEDHKQMYTFNRTERGHSFSTYARRGGGGVKQMRTNAYKGGGGVDT